jgi:predicted RNase H-like HicB family nuclease
VRDISAVSITVSEKANADGHFVAECSELPFCIAQGRTPLEAWKRAKQAANHWLATMSCPVIVGRRRHSVA